MRQTVVLRVCVSLSLSVCCVLSWPSPEYLVWNAVLLKCLVSRPFHVTKNQFVLCLIKSRLFILNGPVTNIIIIIILYLLTLFNQCIVCYNNDYANILSACDIF